MRTIGEIATFVTSKKAGPFLLTLDIVDATGKTMKKMVWETGKAYWLDKDPAGQQHGDINHGKEPIEVIVVEMRR